MNRKKIVALATFVLCCTGHTLWSAELPPAYNDVAGNAFCRDMARDARRPSREGQLPDRRPSLIKRQALLPVHRRSSKTGLQHRLSLGNQPVLRVGIPG